MESIEEKILLAKAIDALALCEKQYRVKYLGFLTPLEAAIIKREVLTKPLPYGVRATFFGGYPEAERCIFAALPDYADESVLTEELCALKISGRDIEALSHRDYLGSLLGLGIKREKVGDILRLSDYTVVLVLADISDYIISNLDKVGSKRVKIERLSFEEFSAPQRQYDEIKTTVAALRLDCIVAAAMRTSRSSAALTINSGKVSLNWLECDDVSAKVSPGDVLSIRGAGRFRLDEKVNTTKKGRLGICIQKAK